MNFERMRKGIQRFAKYRLRKIHLDWIISILSIPVLLTAIIINWSNLTHRSSSSAPTASPSPQVIIVPQNQTTQPTSSPSCTKSVGPVTISAPLEGQVVSDNPVCITISYPNSSYCSVVWSYRINGGAWSDFTNNSPCLYNLPNGSVKFDLRVNSTVSSDNTTLSRNFSYSGSNNITPTSIPTQNPTPTSVASSSAH